MLRDVCSIFLIGAMATLPAGAVRDNGLARTPPMGWSSRSLGVRMDDATAREIADAIDANGMRQAGYSYLVIGDSWQGPRDGQGDPRPNDRFPDMRALASYVHSRGLFIGLFSAPCQKSGLDYEGSFGHEEQDARVFASWKIDFLEYSGCTSDRMNEEELRAAYKKMGGALLRTGRPVVYSIGNCDKCDVWKWARQTGANLWRVPADRAEALTEFAAPGGWNNPGPIAIGTGAGADSALRAHISMWAMLAAPMFVEGDPRIYSRSALSLLTNREAIGVDQDPAGTPGFRMSANNGLEVWSRPLADGGKAVCWFNRRDARARFTMAWQDFGVDSKSVVRDLWQHRVLDHTNPEFVVDVDKHDVMMVRVFQTQ